MVLRCWSSSQCSCRHKRSHWYSKSLTNDWPDRKPCTLYNTILIGLLNLEATVCCSDWISMHNAITWYMTRQDLQHGICLTGFPCTMALPGLWPAEILDLASFRLRLLCTLKCLSLYLVFNNSRRSQSEVDSSPGLEWTCLDVCSLLARSFNLQQIQKLFWLGFQCQVDFDSQEHQILSHYENDQ